MSAQQGAQPMPALVKHDSRYALMVDGKPYLMLGSQINNSSSWASTLPEVWPALEAMHVNTVEAPVYWESMEPVEGTFDTFEGDKLPAYLTDNFALLTPLEAQIAQWVFDGKLQTAVEMPGKPRTRLHFAAVGGAQAVDAVVSFGFPQHDGEPPPGTADASGRALIARLGPMEFVVTGFAASVSFEPAVTPQAAQQLEILTAEQGTYVDGMWQKTRIWNGDQTDRGLNFPATNKDVVRIRLQALPLYAH